MFAVVLTPIVISIAGFFLARRRDTKGKVAGNLLAGMVCGVAALFASWWALGMSVGVLSAFRHDSMSLAEILAMVGVEAMVLFFPFVLWYLCSRCLRRARQEEEQER